MNKCIDIYNNITNYKIINKAINNTENSVGVEFFIPSKIHNILSSKLTDKDILYKYLYVVDYIYQAYFYKKEEYNCFGVPIYHRVLRKNIGRGTKDILTNLVKWDIIRIRKNYSTITHTSTTYEFKKGVDLCNPQFETIYFKDLRSNSWIKKLKCRGNDKMSKYQFNILKNHISVSQEGHNFYRNKHKDLQYPDLSTEEKMKKNQCDIELWKFIEGKFRCNRDGESRLYSNLSNLKSTYRKYLLLDNSPMYSIDISNSQLVFSLPVIEKKLLAMGLPMSDFDDFKRYVLNGNIYEQLYAKAKRWKKKIPILLGEERKGFKQKFFKEVWYATIKSNRYGNIPKKFSRGLPKVFKQEFPNVFTAINNIKKNNHADFPILLQKEEARFVLDIIGKELMNRNVTFLTLHDGFFIPEKDKADVETLLKQKFQLEYGFVPNFKTELVTLDSNSLAA